MAATVHACTMSMGMLRPSLHAGSSGGALASLFFAVGSADCVPDRYATVWIALTAATTDNSCLHFVPAPADPGYYAGEQPPLNRHSAPPNWQTRPGRPVLYNAGDDSEGDKDPMQCCFPDKEAYQHIRAVPLEAGGASFHTHRIIHWGSSGRAAAEVRIPAFCFAAALDPAVARWLMRRRLMPGGATNLHVVLLF